MKIGCFDVTYLSHVCFRFRTPAGRVLVTDPFFGAGFTWQGHEEKYLTPPDMPASAIKRCDVIFISHIHGDHCDADAVRTIHAQTGAKVLSAPEILEDLRAKGLPADALVEAREGAFTLFGDLRLRTYAGYDNSFDDKGRANKFALIIESESTRLFYSGDCHQLPPAVVGQAVDASFCWPHPNDAKLTALVDGLKTDTFVVMHGDRFTPGEFFCNFDLADQAKRMNALRPRLNIVIPARAEAIDD